MLDVKNVKTILQAEVTKREKAKEKWLRYRSQDKKLQDLYENRYRMYCVRLDGMCDMLYDLGYLAWVNEYNDVFVLNRDDSDIPFVDEIPL